MKNIFFLTSLIYCLLFSNCSNSESIDKKALKVVSQFNDKCPMMIDAETRMDGIEIKDGNTIKYKYTLINLLSKNVDTSAFNSNLRKEIVNTIKTNSELDELKRINSNFEYYYKDRENNFIYSFMITPNDYKLE
ncbi:MAG: hypothetical protein WCH21_00310 [Bacteroidota bacterium]